MDKEDIKFVINALRRATTTWPARNLCLNEGRRKRVVGTLKNGKEKTVWEHDCKSCGKWFDMKDNQIEVDHIEMCGSFTGDWNTFIPRIFCPQSNLQRLCVECHLRKSNIGNSTLRFERKTKKALDNSASDLRELSVDEFGKEFDPLDYL